MSERRKRKREIEIGRERERERKKMIQKERVSISVRFFPSRRAMGKKGNLSGSGKAPITVAHI